MSIMEPSSEPPRPGPDVHSNQDPELSTASGPELPSADTPDAVIDTAHLARFEFSDAGTKILMVEWEPDAVPEQSDPIGDAVAGTHQGQDTATDAAPAAAFAATTTAASSPPAAATGAAAAAWQVSWPGKSTFLPARDAEAEHSSSSSSSKGKGGARRRIFFLLPSHTPIPATVTITPPGRSPIEVKPLPAIFPEGFLDHQESGGRGSRGVLHTIWAKQRLKELEREIHAEMAANAESVGVDMALAEKQWIVETFLPPPPSASATGMTPVTPRSPGIPGRLGEKLKGLRLATSPDDLTPAANTFVGAASQSQTLSPLGSDVAVSSFASIPRPMGQVPLGMAAGAGGAMSLNAIANGEIGSMKPEAGDAEEDLFALPMSPRSPEMKKSPFSIL